MISTNGNGIKKVAIYMRVSKDEQAKESYSLDQQLDRLRNHCKGQEWEINV